MGAKKEHPKYNVVSVRLSDKNLHWLDKLAKKRKTTRSNVIMEALVFLAVKEV